MRHVWSLIILVMAGFAGGLARGAEPSDPVPVGLPDADIFLLGEVHGNPEHHNAQAALLLRIAPNAVVFEQLTAAQAEAVAQHGTRDLAALEDALNWEASGWPPFENYAPLFIALADTPALSAAGPHNKVRFAFQNGAAAAFGAQAEQFALTSDLPPDQLEARKTLQFQAHCEAIPFEMMGGMVEAQRYRDAAFAQSALAALDRFGAPIVMILGHGHARTDWGVPALIRRAAPEVRVHALAFVEGAGPDSPFDQRVSTPEMPRGDPCAVFSNSD